MIRYLAFLLLLVNGLSLRAQSDIKIMSYNVLNYPEGEMPNRIDTLSRILEFYEPDLLLLQELKSEQGLQYIVQELNALWGGYTAGTYVPQISNPENNWRLQQNLIFNSEVFELLDEQTIETPYRDINYFQLGLLKEDGSTATELVHTYVTHLKSSQGSTNEQLRLSMVEVLNEHIALLPQESMIIVAGDFNVYGSAEPAYQLLLSDNGSNTLNDPIDMPGWAGTNFPNREIFTQSTRLSALDDGAGGGIDDRFDFVLLSEQLMSQNGNLVYQDDSYKALGNNGTCYNQDLIDCTTEDNVPEDLLSSLYYMSDHLPIVLSLGLNEAPSGVSESNLRDSKISVLPNPSNTLITFKSNHKLPLLVRIFSVEGKLLKEQEILVNETAINISQLPEGLFLLRAINQEMRMIGVSKLSIQR